MITKSTSLPVKRFDWTAHVSFDTPFLMTHDQIIAMVARHDEFVYLDSSHAPDYLQLRTTLRTDDLVLARSNDAQTLVDLARDAGIPIVATSLEGFIDAPDGAGSAPLDESDYFDYLTSLQYGEHPDDDPDWPLP